jgi:hypothetical protein
MPDFGPVRSDEDELQQTVAMAHASLKPLIGQPARRIIALPATVESEISNGGGFHSAVCFLEALITELVGDQHL